MRKLSSPAHIVEAAGRQHQGMEYQLSRSTQLCTAERIYCGRLLAALALTALTAWLAAPVALADHGCDSTAQTSSGAPGADHSSGDHQCPSPAPPAPPRAPAATVPRPAGPDQAAASQLQAPAVPAPDFRPQTGPAEPVPAPSVPAGMFPPVRPDVVQHPVGPDWGAMAVAIGLLLVALAGAWRWSRRRLWRGLAARWPNG